MTLNLCDLIYASRSNAEVIANIREVALRSGLPDDSDFAKKMERAHQLTSDPIIMGRMRDLLVYIQDGPQKRIIEKMRKHEKKERERLSKESGKEWVSVKPRRIKSSSRVKSLYSSGIKLILLQEEAKQAKKEGKHSREGFLNDLLACRFVFVDNGDVETIGFVFDFFNEVLCFLEESCNCIVLNSSGPVKTSEFNPEEHPTVILPTEDMKVLDKYEGKHKNYFRYPKGNGYQCLHATILDNEYGFVFEIQVVTKKAYDYVNNGESDPEGKEVNEDNLKTSHAWHKNKRYGKVYEKQGVIDPSKIRMDGFYYDPQTGELIDTIMLLQPGVL